MNLNLLTTGGAVALALFFNVPSSTVHRDLTGFSANLPTVSLPEKGNSRNPWQNLFDGKTLSGWHIYQKQGQPVTEKWVVQDGAIHLTSGGVGDLVTDKDYSNFEMEIEWKIAEAGNSGIMYHISEEPKFGATYETGPEMQVLDNERHPDAKAGREGNRTAGALYDLQKPITPMAAKPAGGWNKARLVVRKGKAQHFLNGKKIAEYPTSGPEWDKMVSESKFKKLGGFGKFQTGKIALQDHGDLVWYRNIRIREL